MFSLVVQGLEGFDRLDEGKDAGQPTAKRSTLTVQLEESQASGAIKFVGRWYDIAALPIGDRHGPIVGPILNTIDPDGKSEIGYLIGSPYENARHVLVITCHPIPRLIEDPELVLFYGGFDAREVMDDTSRESGFLTFLYPASDADQLKKVLGTIDR